MKKFTIFLALVIMVAMPTFAEHVTPETARKVATTFLKNNGAKANQLTDLSKAAGFPYLYIFTADEGFVVIAADDCAQPILGYSLTDKFIVTNMPENLRGWLQGYCEEIQWGIDHKTKANPDVAKQWKDLTAGKSKIAKAVTVVQPLIQTQWDQVAPYNGDCPGNGILTGCVATAMAQIMKYWEYPTTGFGSHSYTPYTHPEYGVQTVNFGETTYDWKLMTNTYGATSTNEQKAAIAKLMYHCGVSVNMDYGKEGTGSSATTSDVVDALQNYFNYSQTIRYITRASVVDETGQEDFEQWKNLLKAELNANPPRPIQYRSPGHSFICDGYDSNDNFHFNWGWSGSDNDYYPLNALTPPGHNYNLNQAAIIGIQPIAYDAQPSNLESVVSGQNVSLTWNSVNNACSYNVYRNFNLIGSTESNTFSDTNVPLGEYNYFIRCVDSEGNVSIPSNITTAQVEFGNTLAELKVEHLQLNYENNIATLQWEAPYRLNYLDYFSYTGERHYAGTGSENTLYWGTRFPASMLSQNTLLTSVSTYFYTAGQYQTYVCQCTGGVPPIDYPVATATGTYLDGWNTITLQNPLSINVNQDLWIVFKSTNIAWPLIIGYTNADEGNYYSLNGENWNHFTGYSFFISANLSNGDFTYTLYDNGNSIATNLNAPIYTLNPSSNSVHQYTVKAWKGEEASFISNMTGLTLGTALIESLTLDDNDKMTITENSTLTVNGTLTNTNADNLIIENGGQLFTSSNNVAATVKKTITGHGATDLNGWNFIASPIVANEGINPINAGLITDSYEDTIPDGQSASYDLYYYDEPYNYWRNYRKAPFNLNNGQGYLYADTAGTTINFKGALNATSADPTIVVTASDNNLSGFNLVGNPFARNLNISELALETNNNCSAITAIYEISNGKVIINATPSDIPPCGGFFIKATETGILHFNHTRTGNNGNNYGDLKIEVSNTIASKDGTTLLDRAYINFGEGDTIDKFMLNPDATKLYIPQNGKDFAIVTSNAQGELPLNFRAAKDGTYTLTINPEGVEMNYLHLIDNLTGNDVDLLAIPDYTFEAKTTDYASRFRLVFASVCDDTDDDNENFAFINDGNIIINQEGTLQIVDLTGRMIYQGDAKHCVSTTGMAQGVYILRLIDGENVKTQKIVIE